MIPPFVNQSITQLMNTSLVAIIAVPGLLYNGTRITADTCRPLEVCMLVALNYFALLFPSTLLAQVYERRLAARPHQDSSRRNLTDAAPLHQAANLLGRKLHGLAHA